MTKTLINSFIANNKDVQAALGERLYEKITGVVIPEWKEAFNNLSKKDCEDYIYNLTIDRTFDGYVKEKSVVNDGLAMIFKEIRFEEIALELDYVGDIDYLGYVSDEKAFGIQIKPVTAKSNFGNYSVSERMKASFADFKYDFGGNVFIVYSLAGEIANIDVLEQIRTEIGGNGQK